MGKGRDAATGAAQGAAIGTYFGGPGWGTAIGGGLGALGGFFGITPGSGGDEINKRRQEAIAKARALVSGAQSFGAQQAGANLQSLAQIFGPANDRLARLYGDGARVNIPTMGGPLGDLAYQPVTQRRAPPSVVQQPPPEYSSPADKMFKEREIPPELQNKGIATQWLTTLGLKPKPERPTNRATPTRRG